MCRALAWFAVATILSLVACSTNPVPGDVVPDDAFGPSSDPLPGDAVELDEAEYNALVESGDWMPVTVRSSEDQAAAEHAQDAADEATIAAYLEANPAVGDDIIPPDPEADNASVTQLEDGNFLLTLTQPDGGTLEVVTLGRRFWLRTVAEGRRRFAERDNQEAIYRNLYEGLPEDWRVELELPSPDEVEADTSMTVEDIQKLNGRIGDPVFSPSIIADLKDAGRAVLPPAFLSDCDQAIGAVTGGGDLSDSKFDGTCDFDSGGIMANYDWSLRDHLTCVKSQGNRGTCTGFANTATIETLVSVFHGLRVNLSEQAYYNRARLAWDNPTGSVDGHMSEIGFREMNKEGFLLYFENQWGYNPASSRATTCTQMSNGQCVAATYQGSCTGYADTCSDTIHQSAFGCFAIFGFWHCLYYVPDKNPDSLGYRIGNSAQIWNPADKDTSIQIMKLALTLNRPVVMGHPITGAFSAAAGSDGYLRYVANDSIGGGHGMQVVGFIDNDELADIVPSARAGVGGGYFIIKNSWGNCSGDGGFLYIPYQSVLDYAADVTVLYYVL